MTSTFGDIESAAALGTEMLLVRQGDEYFALELTAAIEALELPTLSALAESNPMLLGMATVRGAELPVFEAGAVLEAGRSDAAERMLVIVRDGTRHIGLAVDEIEDVIMVYLTTVQRPMSSMRADSVVRGVVRSAHLLVALLDARALVKLAACVLPEHT